MKFVFLLVILVLSHTAHAADTVRVIKFKTIGLTVNEYNIADLRYKKKQLKSSALISLLAIHKQVYQAIARRPAFYVRYR